MILEYALNEEDEFKRMETITKGCQQLAQYLPFQQNFTNHNIIKQLFCCYPFQLEPIGLLLQVMMDRFKTIEFLNCFYQGIHDLAMMQEQKMMLSSRQTLKGKSLIKIQVNQSIAKQVIENLVISKQYAISFIKPMFQMAEELKQPMESRVGIFMNFILNTKDETIVKNIVDVFTECKNDIFGTCTWVNRIEDQFDSYFYSNHLVKSERSFQVDQNSLSDSSIEIDINEEIQKWICQKDIPSVSEQLEYFRNQDSLEYFFRYIFDPCHFTAIHEWVNYIQSKKPEIDEDIEKFQHIRSLQTVLLLIKESNYLILCKLIPTFLIKIFNYIYDALIDQYKNIDLNHIALLIDFLLKINPRQSMYAIVEFNLIFSFSRLLFNDHFAIITQKILFDEYQFGNFIYDHFWQYLDCNEWIQFLFNLILNEKIDYFQMNKNQKNEKSVNIIIQIKQQSNFDSISNDEQINLEDKKIITDYLGQMQPGKNYIQYYGMNQLNWHLNKDIKEYITSKEFIENDIDNLKFFIQQRQISQSQIKIQIKDKSIKPQIIKLDISLRRNSKRFLRSDIPQIQIPLKLNTQSEYLLPKLNIPQTNSSKWINTQKSQFNISVAQTPQSVQVQCNPKTEHSVDFSSFYEGFSTSRLRKLYPSTKTIIQSSSFERKANKYSCNRKLISNSINLLKHILQSAFQNMLYLTTSDKKLQALIKTQQDIILKLYYTKEVLSQLFKIYLYDMNNKLFIISDIAQQCGIMINEIYYNCQSHRELQSYKYLLQVQFAEIADYLCKVIVKMNENDNNSPIKKCILITSLEQGFSLFELNAALQCNVFTSLNETVLHLLIIWFFDSENNCVYQQQFVKLITIIFSRASSYLVGNILFKLGLITSLQNAYYNFFVNGIKYTTEVENLFFYVGLLIYSIRKTLNHRRLNQLLINLEPLGSWKQLQEVEIDTENKFVQVLDFLIQEPDLNSPRMKKKRTTINLINKSNASRSSIAISHKGSMHSTAVNLLNMLKVKERLIPHNKKNKNY